MKKKLKLLVMPILPSILIIGILGALPGYAIRLTDFHVFEFRNVLSILKAGLGFDLFLFVLFLTGFAIVWKNEQRRPLHLALLTLVMLSLFNTTARVFASFIITFYCVKSILFFQRRKWGLEVIKAGTLLLVLCSMVFSATNQINILVNAQPDKDLNQALVYLYSYPKGIVLTSDENGFLVEYIAEDRVVLDSNSIRLNNYQELKNASDLLFKTVRINDAEPILQKLGVRYVMITPGIKEELWSGREQGLWFLMKNSESFIKKYDEKGIEIWEYAPQKKESVV